MHFVHVDGFKRDGRDNVSLDSLIDNIKLLSDFYQRASLTYKIGTRTPLFDVLCEKGILQPEPEKVEEEKKAEDEPTVVTTPTNDADEAKDSATEAAKVEGAKVEGDEESKQEATPAAEHAPAKEDVTPEEPSATE